MDAVERAKEFAKTGRYAEARCQLNTLNSSRLDSSTALLKASVLEMTGDLDLAGTLAEQILRSRALSDSHRAAGELILSRVAVGNPDSELLHLKRALSFAERARDVDQISWIQLRLLALSADRSGSDSCGPLMASLRRNVSSAGNPCLSAALHLFVAEIDGKHGLLSKSKRHVRLAISIVDRYPNVWLAGWAETTLLALSILNSDIPAALRHGDLALRMGRESGVARVLRSALANLGKLHVTTGEVSRGLEYLDQALGVSTLNDPQAEGTLETIARAYMIQGRLSEAEQLLDRFSITDRGSARTGGYVHRHSLLTKAELFGRLGRIPEALVHFDETIALANRAGDSVLEYSARLLAGELRDITGMPPVEPSCTDLVPPPVITPDLAALYERALMTRLAVSGALGLAAHHKDRAARICRSVNNRSAEAEVIRIWDMLVGLSSGPSTPITANGLLQDVASLLLHAGRPELVATGLVSILQHSTAAVAARALCRAADNTEECIATWGTVTDPAAVRTFPIGTSRERVVELQVQPHPDVESHATVNAVGFVIASGQEIERARVEREERLTLWPVDELPAEDDDSVVAGRMAEVMLQARRIAPSTTTVLITGESGTGKEVLARAIHRYSNRSKKPFVPFNCTAVPRELLESHLFGFKRGAFTGADRDNPGLIRAAKDGTLFLDEIGELGLDLQPKLLRFLESGEINPLGETAPFAVNVRIVAATNANLRKMVEEGRFREDLYYRLTVFPLELPPLRERRDEIPPLAQHFALKWSHELGKGCIRVADDLMEHLKLYHWPGNIRQLSNEIHRMVAVAEPDVPLTLDLFPRALREETEQLKRRANGLEMAVPLGESLPNAMAMVEREMIAAALRAHNGKVEAAAKALGISRKGLYLKRLRLGL